MRSVIPYSKRATSKLALRACIFSMLIFAGSVNAYSQDIFDQREQNLVGGLRDRALFDLAESHCQTMLKRDGLTATDLASIAVERIRNQASRSRTASDRSVHWQAVEKIAKEFSTAHPDNPKSVLVGLQQALAHMSFASVLDQELEARIGGEAERIQGLEQLTRARAILDRTRQQSIDTVQAQANKTLTSDMMTNEQLRTLKTNIEYQLAIVNLTSARLTDASTEAGKLNQIDSLGRVPPQLASVRNAVANSKPLWWKTWICEASCRRMLGEFNSADRILKTLDKTRRPTSVNSMLLEERVELAIAMGDRNRMQQLASVATKQRHGAETEIGLVRLLVTAGMLEDASRLAGKVATRHGPWWARRADIALLSGGRNVTSKPQPQAIDAASERMLLEVAEKAERNGDLEAAKKGFRSVAESLFLAGDRAGGLATIVRAATVLEKEGKHQQAAELLLKHGKDYAVEKIAASIHLRGCWNLSKAKSSNFVTETTSHIKQWPGAESANQARYWLASNQLSQNEFARAFKTLAGTQPESTKFPAAIKLARYACRKQLLAAESKGLATRSLARQMIPKWKEIYASCQQPSKPMVAVAIAELALGWRAEDKEKTHRRMKGIAELPPARSNPEFHYLWAMLVSNKEVAQRIATANELPFDSPIVMQTLRLLDRLGPSKRVGELKLAIAENALSETKDAKLKGVFRFAKADALVMLNKTAEASKIFKDLAKSDPRNLKVLVGLARISKGSEALKMWRSIASRTAAQSSAWFEAKYNVARLLHESGKSSEAEKMLKYIKAVPPGWDNSVLRPKFERLLKESGK